MRILLTIHHHLDPDSGAPGITWQLARCYEALGHDVRHLSFDDFPDRMRERAAAVAFPSLAALKIQRLAANGSLDVIDASSGDGWIWDRIRRRRASPNDPLLVTRSHGLEHTAHREFLREVAAGHESRSWKYPLYWGGFRLWEVARSVRRSDMAIFSNSADRAYAIDELGVSPARARVMPNGVPTSFLAGPFEVAGDSIKIAQVGSYIPRKGTRYGAQALNGVLRRHPSVRVSFLGTGHPPEDVLRDFDPAVRAQVEVRPRFTREELPQLLRQHQIKLMPTLFEGFSVAMIEAMACGLTPVTTATAGAVDVVVDGSNGVLVPPRDSPALEAALERVIENPALLHRLRRGAYETAQAYGWERIAKRTLALYEEAAEAKRANRRPAHEQR